MEIWFIVVRVESNTMALTKGLAAQCNTDLNACHRHEEAMTCEDLIVYTRNLWLVSCS